MRMIKINKFVWIIVIVCAFCLSAENLIAAEVYLKNNDKITGEIIKEDKNKVVIQTEAMGEVTINREFVERITTDEELALAKEKEEKQKLWQREISLGYNDTRGNTENSQLSMNLFANRKTSDDEFTIKGDTFYSSTDKKMDAQKYYGMLRYAFSFWERKWYNFYKLEADHDRFANIDYRLVPSVGVGYWFSDTDNYKAMVELGLGLEHTTYRDDTKDSDNLVCIPSAFLEKKLFGESRISQDLFLYPTLTDGGEYRLHSETVFTNPITEKLSFRLRFIDDYNSDPPADTKKNDSRLISSLVYSF